MNKPSEDTWCATESEFEDGIYTMYHGTSLSAARSIQRFGFIPSPNGKLGRGVYVTRDFWKAVVHAKARDPAVLQLRVWVGKTVKIDKLAHPLRWSWHQAGYDSAWSPANPRYLEAEQHCIWDPKRIAVLKIMTTKCCVKPPTSK